MLCQALSSAAFENVLLDSRQRLSFLHTRLSVFGSILGKDLSINLIIMFRVSGVVLFF